MSKQADNKTTTSILVGTFIISFCGLVYELIISTVASYLIGSSIFHFSLTIGLFLFFMGVGAFFSKFIHHKLEQKLIFIETLIGIFGGLSSLILFLGFAYTQFFYVIYFLITAAIGICTGLEVPLATRIIESQKTIKKALADVLTFDYIGALIGAIIFPLVLLPYLGLTQTAIVIGMLNLIVAFVFYQTFSAYKSSKNLVMIIVSFVVLTGVLVMNQPVSNFIENSFYQDEIIYRDQTPYQKIVMTRFKDDIRLYLDGNLQFSSRDEHRYHDMLVHAPFSFVRSPENILVIGGGDGLAAREILKYDTVKNVTVVDLDKKVTDVAQNQKILLDLNKGSLLDGRVVVLNQDAFNFLEATNDYYDIIIIDLPDPASHSVGKLYTKEFYTLASRHINRGGILITQASSPYYARKAFWSINATLNSVFEYTKPMNIHVPTFGHWGLIMARNEKFIDPHLKLDSYDFFDQMVLNRSFYFDADMDQVETYINTLQNQSVVEYYEQSLSNWQ